MAFAMRMNFVDVVVSDSLKNYTVDGEKMGYQFDIRLSYYPENMKLVQQRRQKYVEKEYKAI